MMNMKYAAKAIVAATGLATAAESQIITARAKSRMPEDSAFESYRDEINRLRALQEGAGIGSMSYPTEESIGAFSDAETMTKSGKSGKGPQIPNTNYDWVAGEYSNCTQTSVHLLNGEIINQDEDWNRTGGNFFSVSPLNDSSRMFIATLTEYAPCFLLGLSDPECPNSPIIGDTEIRYIHEGVGSYNPLFKNQITFYADHQEYLKIDNATDNEVWVPLGDSGSDDVSTVMCSKLEHYPDGDTIVCDVYESTTVQGASWEIVATVIFSEG